MREAKGRVSKAGLKERRGNEGSGKRRIGKKGRGKKKQ